MLIFIGSLTGGGAERVATGLCRYLVDHHCAVYLVTMHRTDRDFYALDSRVGRVCLGLTTSNRGIHKVFANLKRIGALRAVIKAESPDVVIGMMSTSAVISILACLGLRTSVIASERNYPGRKSIDTSWALLRKLFYRFAGAHVAQTQESADWIFQHTAARNIHVIPNSVSWPVPSCPPEIEPDSVLDPGSYCVLAVGSKAKQKGFDLLLRAFSSALDESRDWHLVILGLDGPGSVGSNDGNGLRRQVDSLGIGGRVHFPGRAGNVTDWYKRADIFVLSSRYEGFPNALLEAMAAGCPSVAFDCDTGPRDIIEHESNGLLVPAEDVEALAAALRHLMDDPKLRGRLALAAITVSDRFSEDHVLDRWLEVIDGLAS
ncbi:glycosyltransferase family 4 protein [Pseudomonadota bacterium]